MLGLHDIFWRPNPHFGRLTSPPVYDPLTENCLMWVSDYPHRDVVPYFPNTVGGMLVNVHLSQAFEQKLL